MVTFFSSGDLLAQAGGYFGNLVAAAPDIYHHQACTNNTSKAPATSTKIASQSRRIDSATD